MHIPVVTKNFPIIALTNPAIKCAAIQHSWLQQFSLILRPVFLTQFFKQKIAVAHKVNHYLRHFETFKLGTVLLKSQDI